MLPNFLVVGAAKAGTTSLHEYLNQHPDVFIPEKKECLFFSALEKFNGPDHDQELNRLAMHDIDSYEALFANARAARALGDISHDYLYYHDSAIPNIKRYLGDQVRIAIILRDPRERAYSHYMHHVKGGISPDSSFDRALELEGERIKRGWSWNWHYKRVGLYAAQVSAYIGAFSNCRVYLYDDLVRDACELMTDLYSFVGVDATFHPSIEIHNQGYDVRNRRMNRFLRRESQLKGRVRAALMAVGFSQTVLHRLKQRALLANKVTKERMSSESRRRLTEYFRPDIERLEGLIGRNLSGWYE